MARRSFGSPAIPSTRIPKPGSIYPIPGTVPRISNPMEEGMRVQRNLATKARIPRPTPPRY